jgi:hypothetical protein
MATLHYDENADMQDSEITLYYCESCRAFHLTAGPMCLSFEASEFAGFIDRATETYWEQALRGKLPDLRMGLQSINPPPESSGAAGH